MITNCPVCGKAFDILYPDLWSYKRSHMHNRLFLCSWGCLRQYDKGKEEEKTMAMMKKDGTPAKKPGPKQKKIEVPEAPVLKVDGALKIETPEPEKVVINKFVPLPRIDDPAKCNGMTIREVEGLFGRYRYTVTPSACYIDFENTERMDTLSLTVEQWRKFREEQVKAAKILGVEL